MLRKKDSVSFIDLLSNKSILQTIQFIKKTFVQNKYKDIQYTIIEEYAKTHAGRSSWIIILKELNTNMKIEININEYFLSINDENNHMQVIFSLDDEYLNEKIASFITVVTKVNKSKKEKQESDLLYGKI